MTKKKFLWILFLNIFIYVDYLIFYFLENNFLVYSFSILIVLSSFGLLIKSALNAKGDNVLANKIAWFSLSFASLIRAIADIIFLFYYLKFYSNPKEIIYLELIYYLSNIFYLIAIILVCIITFKKWNLFLLFLDSISITISTILLVWILLFNQSFEIIEQITTHGLIHIVISIIDIVILVATFIYFSSIRDGKVLLYIGFVSSGIIVFVITDLYFHYMYFYYKFYSNPIFNISYIAGFLLISIGTSFKIYFKNNQNDKVNKFSNVGSQKRGSLLFIFPIVVLLFKGFNLAITLHFILIILIRETLNTHIQTSIKNETLLAKEMEMNYILEEKIKQRTIEITDKNTELETKNKELDFLSNRDTLTSLYNRRYFINALQKKFKLFNPSQKLAVLFIDLDHFKKINDIYGHYIGDKVLIEISNRLATFSNEKNIISRLGGDEFVICCHGNLSNKEIENLCNLIAEKFSQAIEIEQYIFYLSASIGISIYPIDATDVYTLMKNADIAMYQAKARGIGKYEFFDTKFKNILNRKNDIEIQLKKVNYDNEFELFYQPQFSIPSRKLIGAEALLRWNNKVLGSISPSEFIVIAEETNCINSIGQWVMEKSIKQIATWNNTCFSKLKIGINVSPKQLDSKSFIPTLKNIMENNSVPPEYIDIEITESIAIKDKYTIKQIENLFSGIGVSISIDDFGTGYASLNYIKLFPFERIKIAKSLIDVISTDKYDLHILKAIIMLAKSIGIKTIAEGVEQQEQLDILIELECDEIQGYLLGKPVSAETFEKMYLQ